VYGIADGPVSGMFIRDSRHPVAVPVIFVRDALRQ
jgi:hypothetical protein